MLRYSLRLTHKVRDRAGNAHSFAFDTMTNVYRDAVYTGDTRYVGNPMHPERSSPPHPAAPSASSSSSSSVTTTATTGVGDLRSTTHEMTAEDAKGRRRQRHSGVQLEVLRLYRNMLRETRRLEDKATQENLGRFIRDEFQKNSDIPRRFVTRIEWQLHHGKNKLEELRNMRSDTKFTLMR